MQNVFSRLLESQQIANVLVTNSLVYILTSSLHGALPIIFEDVNLKAIQVLDSRNVAVDVIGTQSPLQFDLIEIFFV